MVDMSIVRSLLLIFVVGELTQADDLQCPNTLAATTTLRKLKRHIFCVYDRWLRPVRSVNDTVDVALYLVVKRIDFDDRSDMLTVHSLFVIFWKDFHLVWDPKNFDDITSIDMPSYSIWNPDIGIYNSANEKAFSPYLKSTMCSISNYGDVVCVAAVEQAANCAADLTRWPYDSHLCVLTFGSWSHDSEKLNTTVSEPGISLTDYNPNHEWNLVSSKSYRNEYKFCCPNVSYPHATFEFLLERHFGNYTASIILPVIMLMLLILTSYWLDAMNPDRLILIIINIFLHFICLQYVGSLVPPNGDTIPLIVSFYRDSLVLGSMAMFVTLIVRGLRTTSKFPPLWVSGVSSWIVQNRVGQILIFHTLDPKSAASVSEGSGDEGAGLVGSSLSAGSTSDWDTFTALIDLIAFIISCLTYSVLLLGFLP